MFGCAVYVVVTLTFLFKPIGKDILSACSVMDMALSVVTVSVRDG